MKFHQDGVLFLDFDTLQQVKYRTQYFRANPFFNGVMRIFSDPNPTGVMGFVDQTWVDRNRSFLRNQVGQKLNVKNASKDGKKAARNKQTTDAVVPVGSRLRNIFERDGEGRLKMLFADEIDPDGEPHNSSGQTFNRYDLKCARGVYRCRFQMSEAGKALDSVFTADLMLQKNLGKNRFWRLEKTTREKLAIQ